MIESDLTLACATAAVASKHAKTAIAFHTEGESRKAEGESGG